MKTLKIILTIMIAVLALVGIVLYVVILAGNSQGGLMLRYGEVLIVLTSILALFFGLLNLVTNPQALKKTLISIAVFVILLILAYVSADSEMTDVTEVPITESTSKWVGTGIYMFYFLAGIAILSMIIFGIRKTLKR